MYERYGLARPVNEATFPGGESALLEFTNNEHRDLRFDIPAVEYKADDAWREVVHQPWCSGFWLPSGTSATIPVPRPDGVPRDAPWRIQFVCCPDGEVEGANAARMVSSEIPPIGPIL